LSGFRVISVTDGKHPYVSAWWPPGHIIGYEHSFTHTVHDFLQGVVDGKSPRPDFEDGLREKLGEDESCPHGNRVGMDRPQDRRERGWKPLDEISERGVAQVTSVFERDRRLLEYLDGLGIRPGVKLRMVSRNYDETLTLKVGGKAVQLGRPAAMKVWITQAQ